MLQRTSFSQVFLQAAKKERFIEIQRLAPYMERGSDVPVVLDLMIHDIDLVIEHKKLFFYFIWL